MMWPVKSRPIRCPGCWKSRWRQARMCGLWPQGSRMWKAWTRSSLTCSGWTGCRPLWLCCAKWRPCSLFCLPWRSCLSSAIRCAWKINNRHQEIRVLALIGATDGFVRRPFLYSGLWYGLAGGVLAWLLTELGLLLLAGPVERLSASYAGTFALSSLPAGVVALFAGGSGLLGIIGAWLVVERHLKSIHPE